MNSARSKHLRGQTHIVLGSVLDISHARHLYTELGAALDGSVPLVLDSRQVTRIDTATMQLLAVFCLAARARNIQLTWKDPTAVIQQAAELLDLKKSLGLPA